MADAKNNLWQRINAVMSDIQYLCKDDRVKFGSTDYKAISEEKVTSTVRESLIKNGLVIVPVEQEHLKDGNITTVNVKYKIVNIDKPEEFEILTSSGTGADTQDKGVGKAMTYAYKYMLLRTFAIPTGEDPDKISSEELDTKQSKSKKSSNRDAAGESNTDNEAADTITTAQQRRLFALSKGNAVLVKEVIAKHKYYETKQIKKSEYNAIAKEIETEAIKTAARESVSNGN